MDQITARTGNPYPPLLVTAPDPAAGRAMLANIGSGNSEMTAVNLYFYNSVITEAMDPVLAKAFHAIMIVEMHHLELFAKLSLKLGMDPRLWHQQRRRMVYWSPRDCRYPTEREELLENAMRGELAAIEQYRQQIEQFNDPGIQAVLNRVIEDEQLHVDLFAALLEGKDPASVRAKQPPAASRE